MSKFWNGEKDPVLRNLRNYIILLISLSVLFFIIFVAVQLAW